MKYNSMAKITFIKFVCFSIFLFQIILLPAQINYQWANSIAGSNVLTGADFKSTCMKTDPSGNVYVAGYFAGTGDFDQNAGVYSLTSAGGNDAFFMKLDDAGNLLFAKRIGGANSDIVKSIDVDVYGNIYIAGYFGSTVDFDPGTAVSNLAAVGGDDAFFAKFDNWGNYIFAKAISGKLGEYISSVKVDGNGNCFVAGDFQDTTDFDPSSSNMLLISSGSNDLFIACYDANGSYIKAIACGGLNIDVANSVLIDSSNNCIVSGTYRGTVDFDPGAGVTNLTSVSLSDVFVAKYDLNLNFIYAKSIGADIVTSTTLDLSGNIYITGTFQGTADFDPGTNIQNLTSAGLSDIFFEKLDNSGNFVFAQRIGGTQNDHSQSIALDPSNNIYLTGCFNNSVDFDPSASAFILTPDGGASDIFFAAYDNTANFIMAKRFATFPGTTSNNSITGVGISINSLGQILLTGNFYHRTDFDPSSGIENLIAYGIYYNTFIGKYSAIGDLIWVGAIGGPDAAEVVVNGIVREPSGNIIVAGKVRGTVDFDPGQGVDIKTATGYGNAFFAKYDSSGNYIFSKVLNSLSTSEVRSVTLDKNGNIYLGGLFSVIIDFDPDSTTAYSSFGATGNCFFAKYDSLGNFIFFKEIGPVSAFGPHIAVDTNQNIYIAGAFRGTVDFDPSAVSVTLTSTGTWDEIYFAKYNSIGDYNFAKKIGALSSDIAHAIILDDSANIYIAGTYFNSCDFDPGPSVHMLTSPGMGTAYFAKYTTNGDYVYAKKMAATSSSISYGIYKDGNALFLSGFFGGTCDFDPDTSVANVVGAMGVNGFFAKYDLEGNYIFAKQLYGGGRVERVVTDSLGNIFIAGTFTTPTDFDPDTSSFIITVPTTYFNVFMAEYDSIGSFIDAKAIGGTPMMHCYDMVTNGYGDIYVVGDFDGTVDFNPGVGTALLTENGSLGGFFGKYNSSPYPILNISSSAVNVSCYGLCNGVATVNPIGGVPPFSYSWSNGNTTQTQTGLCAGTYTATITDSIGRVDSAVIIISQPGLLSVDAYTTDTLICEQSCTNLNTIPSGGVGSYSFNWIPATELSVQSINNPTGCLSASTTFTLTVTDANGCVSSDTISIFTDTLPSVIYSQNPSLFCDNATAFTLSSGYPLGGIYSGTGVSGITFDPSSVGSGVYTVYYSYVGANGCQNSSSSDITVSVCTDVSSVVGDSQITTFPNPTASELTITGIHKNSKIILYSILGDQLQSLVATNDTEIISLKLLPSGSYTLFIIDEDFVTVKKIIKN